MYKKGMTGVVLKELESDWMTHSGLIGRIYHKL